jgi:hypothetical protein
MIIAFGNKGAALAVPADRTLYSAGKTDLRERAKVGA